MKCEQCGKDRDIVNKFFGLCLYCNNERLKESKQDSKYGKRYENTRSERKSLKPKVWGLKKDSKVSLAAPKVLKPKTAKEKIIEDEIFYEKCFNLSDHKCEECGADLPEVFRDDDGKVVARYRFSHIIPKSVAPELRHLVKNINHLCQKHHDQWDFKDKESMKIFEENRKKFPSYF